MVHYPGMVDKTVSFTLRPARESDLDSILGIYNWAVNQTFATLDSEPLTREEGQAWWKAELGKSRAVVAVEDGDVIGWARLLPWSGRGFDIYEDLVYVDPVHQGKGVGRSLLHELINQAGSLRCKTVIAAIAADNRGGLNLHRSEGFELVGTVRNAAYKFGMWMDITFMQKAV